MGGKPKDGDGQESQYGNRPSIVTSPVNMVNLLVFHLEPLNNPPYDKIHKIAWWAFLSPSLSKQIKYVSFCGIQNPCHR